MTTTRTAELTLTFDVDWQDYEEWPWVVTLRSVTPRGTGLGGSTTYDHPLALALICPIQLSPPQKECARCVEDTPTGSRICNACAVEESVQQLGCEDWLATTDPPHVFNPPVESICIDRVPQNPVLVIDHKGTIQVRGYMVWHHYSGVDGEDWDEEFSTLESRYVHQDQQS